ncbi:MAG: dUTP diphosphatase [Oscillospiraceae bacterium]|nr:dUTP diphosphatase [Oscillospiraceae bacterium]
MQTLKIKKLCPSATLPSRATPQSAGADLHACIEAPLILPRGGIAIIPTGIAMEIAPGLAGFVFGRSGLGVRHGICPANAVGVIDCDYRGEVKVGLINHGKADYTIQPGERIAQLVLLPVALAEIVEADSLSDTSRGTGGFGSTGKV